MSDTWMINSWPAPQFFTGPAWRRTSRPSLPNAPCLLLECVLSEWEVCHRRDPKTQGLTKPWQPWRAVALKNRSLYSTWNVSLALVRSQDAAELLRLVGYLGNQDLWYELLQAVANRPRFGYYSAGRVRLNLRAGRARRRQQGERGCRQRRRDENQDYTDLLSLSRQGLQNKQCFHDRSYVHLSATLNTGYQKHF
jgi:hypothetical protein